MTARRRHRDCEISTSDYLGLVAAIEAAYAIWLLSAEERREELYSFNSEQHLQDISLESYIDQEPSKSLEDVVALQAIEKEVQLEV